MLAPLYFFSRKKQFDEKFLEFLKISSINSTKFANFLGGGVKYHYTNNKPKLGYRKKKL
jgi:hypothetical protein